MSVFHRAAVSWTEPWLGRCSASTTSFSAQSRFEPVASQTAPTTSKRPVDRIGEHAALGPPRPTENRRQHFPRRRRSRARDSCAGQKSRAPILDGRTQSPPRRRPRPKSYQLTRDPSYQRLHRLARYSGGQLPEQSRANILRGEPVDLSELVNLDDAVDRALRRLGIKKEGPSDDLMEFLAEKPSPVGFGAIAVAGSGSIVARWLSARQI
jgi:hypothetical protein